MATQNIQIGIDLGTTNSEVAINSKGAVEIVKNIWQDEYTPSVFGFDKAKNKIVGKKAYEKLFKDGSSEEEKNYKAEIKRLMGTPEKVLFPNAGLELNAEEISSEILKSLKEDVQRKYPNINLSAAVITVPAYFSILQKEATKRAGNLAGFEHIVLLQEPIAAAMSYGFNNGANENVIVYDFGGGTFDVAIVSSKDGIASVLNQNGDNFLGGKNIDNKIVEEVILPKIKDKYSELDNLNRKEADYKGIFARLKYIAEKAKIELSQLDKTAIEVDITDNNLKTENNNIYLNFEFTRNELEQLVSPLFIKTISLLETAIKDSGIKKDSIKRIVLVGGPTQMPIVKKILEDKTGITVDKSSDPLTAVARGSAIFALSQKIPQKLLEKNQSNDKDIIDLNINYDGLTADDEQLITGSSNSELENDWYLQIQSESGYFNSPKIPIVNGKFQATIKIEPNKSDLYWLYLTNPDGNQVKVNPESISITHGLTSGKAQLSHSVGLAILNGIDGKSEEMDLYFNKGDRLPLEKKKTFHTAHRLKKDDISNPLYIKLMEGESKNPEYNGYIADTGIDGKDLPHDVPEGTEIDITIKFDESSVCSVEWYLPIIDKGGDFRATIMDENITVEDLRKSLEKQRQKASYVEKNCSEREKQAIDDKLAEVTQSVNNAETDEDEKRKANKELKELGQGLEEIEKSKETSNLKGEYKEKLESTREVINEVDLEENKKNDLQKLSGIESQGEEAIKNNDKVMLSRTIDQLFELSTKVLFSNPQIWVYRFNEIKQGEYNFSDPEEGKYYLEKGEKAIEIGDVDELKRCVLGLNGLLSTEEVENINKKAGITR
jgi:molecular chaperone DnaK